MPETSNRIFTIPNMISFVRILLIPVFAVLYHCGHPVAALAVLVLSGLSDLVDGKIARRFHMVSEIGKALDPVADKLTQITLAVLLFLRFRQSPDGAIRAFSWVFLLFLGKELLMLLVSLVMLLLKKRPAAAEIYGKVATVLFYVVMCLLFLAGPEVGVLAEHWPQLTLPVPVVQGMVIAALVATFVAFFSYFPDTYRKLFHKEKKEKRPAE
ncbi:MAG: CDP-alcohol phosphatidyltransferase family protein [Oscillospiraceae bacterium]|nr:CDP-alcohol phosphatidyltransferase family protein [Oscillospiraceae bacterium]